jgi:hypothetical protein
MTTTLEVCEGSTLRPDRSLSLGKTRYPLYRRLGGPQGLSGQVRKILPPPECDPRTVKPVASRYTDYATRSTRIQDTLSVITSIRIIIQPTFFEYVILCVHEQNKTFSCASKNKL